MYLTNIYNNPQKKWKYEKENYVSFHSYCSKFEY